MEDVTEEINAVMDKSPEEQLAMIQTLEMRFAAADPGAVAAARKFVNNL